MALYKRVDSLEALKLMVAEDLYPLAGAARRRRYPSRAEGHLVALVISLRDMVKDASRSGAVSAAPLGLTSP